jgi:hypothetical protein
MSDERPPRLPYSASFVVRASRVLNWGEKAVWQELWSLDKGPEGAWISDRSLGECLGLDEGTVKNYRFGLRRRQLAVTVPRPGARQVGWVVRLPAAAVPGAHEKRVWGKRAVELALILDGHLRTMDGKAGGAMEATSDPPSSPHIRGVVRNTGVAGARGVGGRGEPSSSASLRETQLPPAVRQVGVGAHAPKAKDGEAESVGAILRRNAVA